MLDVAFAVGADLGDAWTGGSLQTRRRAECVRDPVEPGELFEVAPVRRSEDTLETLDARLFEEREDASPVVVDDDEARVASVEEAVRVMQDRDVANEREGRGTGCLRYAQRRRDRAVDPVDASVGEHPQAAARPHERFE